MRQVRAGPRPARAPAHQRHAAGQGRPGPFRRPPPRTTTNRADRPAPGGHVPTGPRPSHRPDPPEPGDLPHARAHRPLPTVRGPAHSRHPPRGPGGRGRPAGLRRRPRSRRPGLLSARAVGRDGPAGGHRGGPRRRPRRAAGRRTDVGTRPGPCRPDHAAAAGPLRRGTGRAPRHPRPPRRRAGRRHHGGHVRQPYRRDQPCEHLLRSSPAPLRRRPARLPPRPCVRRRPRHAAGADRPPRRVCLRPPLR